MTTELKASRVRVKGKFTGEVDEKRFYLPGVSIFVTCPFCGNEIVWDNYLSYPVPGVITEHVYCPDCEIEDIEFTFKLKIEVAE